MDDQPNPTNPEPVKGQSRYEEGYQAGWTKKQDTENPYLEDGLETTPEAHTWRDGWFDGRRDRIN